MRAVAFNAELLSEFRMMLPRPLESQVFARLDGEKDTGDGQLARMFRRTEPGHGVAVIGILKRDPFHGPIKVCYVAITPVHSPLNSNTHQKLIANRLDVIASDLIILEFFQTAF